MSGERSLHVSVIVPSFQSIGTIDACLLGILEQNVDLPFEIIVVDSGHDGTAERVRHVYPSVRLLQADRRMDPAAARNWGAREALGPVLAFIDSDCVPGRQWLQRLCDVLDDGYDGAGGAITNADPSCATSWAGYFSEFREFLPCLEAADVSNLTLGNAAYRRDAFERAGGFPAGFFPQEDQVFHRRLCALGARFRFDPRIVVAHHHRTRFVPFSKHQVNIGAANARVVRALGLPGAAIAERWWLAFLLVPWLAMYRFARTAAACWRFDRAVMVRRPSVPALCMAGMFCWAAGFAHGARRGHHVEHDLTE